MEVVLTILEPAANAVAYVHSRCARRRNARALQPEGAVISCRKKVAAPMPQSGDVALFPSEPHAQNIIPSLIDLALVNRNERAAAWRKSANVHFPGLRITKFCPRPEVGAIAGLHLGPGQLWTVLSPALQVSYRQTAATAGKPELFSLMLQLEGATVARQGGRTSVARPGDMCVIDGRLPFDLGVAGGLSQIVVLQMPRQAVLSRHPFLEHCTATCFDSTDPGSELLRNVLLNVLNGAPAMAEDQRTTALTCLIQLLGAPRTDRPGVTARDWRVRSALALIDATLTDSELTASRIAAQQQISRRHLDEMMVAATGSSLSSRIRSRRLEQVADDLTNPRFADRTIMQVAFAAGFEDIAHFTRAFKRRYQVPPREWRRRQFGIVSMPSAESAAPPHARPMPQAGRR
jgi:AraC family transcriptional activator of tynA and feaB